MKCFLVLIPAVLAMLVAISVEAQLANESLAPPSPRAASLASHIPQLPADLLERVRQDELRRDAVFEEPDRKTASEYAEFIELAEKILQIREKYQGTQWWETLEARHQLADLRQLATFTARQRAELAEAISLDAEAQRLSGIGKNEEAIAFAKRVRDIHRKTWGTKHPDYASSLHNLGAIYRAMRRYEQAEPLFQQALDIRKQTFGDRYPGYALSLNDLAALYKAMGRYEQAELLYKRALETWVKALGLEHPAYATSLYNLASLYHLTGRYSQAKPLYHQALAIEKHALGEMHPYYADSLNNMAALYQSMGYYQEAELLYIQALAIRKHIPGEDHPDYATSLSNLATLYHESGRYKEAESLYQQVSVIVKHALGESHPQYARTQGNLAELYHELGRYAHAETLFRQALAIYDTATRSEHPEYATVLHNFASLYRSMGRYTEAEPLYQQTLEIQKQTLGEHHPNYASTLSHVADLYDQLGRYTEAEPLYQQALAIRKQALGENHPSYAESLDDLALRHKLRGRYDKAETLFRKAWMIRENTLGTIHPIYAISLDNIASLHRLRGHYDKAEVRFLEAQTIRERALGKKHPDYANSLHNLAGLYEALGRNDHVERLYKQALAIRKQSLGNLHPMYTSSLHNLALLYFTNGEYEQAKPLLEEVLTNVERTLGKQHRTYANSLNTLASLYESVSQPAQAERLYEQALSIRKQVLGENHPDYASSLNNLGYLYSSLGRYDQAEPLLRHALTIQDQYPEIGNPHYTATLRNLSVVLGATGRIKKASGLLLTSAHSTWSFVTQNFPYLSEHQKRQFLMSNNFVEGDLFWTVFLSKKNEPISERGLRVALLIKQLLFDAARKESRTFLAVSTSDPEWKATWKESQQLRQQYSTLALNAITEADSFRAPPDSATSSADFLKVLLDKIERLNRTLRYTLPGYTDQAKLRHIKLEHVRAALRPGQAVVEYMHYRPYDFATREWGAPQYGAFVLVGGKDEVEAIALGKAEGKEGIETAVKKLRTAMVEFIDSDEGPKTDFRLTAKQLSTSEAKIAKASMELRKKIWLPLEKALKDVTRVYIAPDGPLSLVPFEMLAQETKKGRWRYLVEDRELVYLNTSRDLARLALRGPTDADAPRTAVLVNNPNVYASPQEVAQVVADLPTSQQVSQIQDTRSTGTSGATPDKHAPCEIIPRNWREFGMDIDQFTTSVSDKLTKQGWLVKTLQHNDAVEEHVLQIQAPRLLQFTTHGIFLDCPKQKKSAGWDNPLLRSMLILAGVNEWDPKQATFYKLKDKLFSEADVQKLPQVKKTGYRMNLADGLLTAYDVTGMNLQGTELVNLTACETGLGEVTPDGVVGLRHAFLHAGARSLTMSMWEVPTVEIMQQIQDFYDGWLNPPKKDHSVARYQAFHEAQLAALARSRDIANKDTHGIGHPFYWAGIVYVGDPGDLPTVPILPPPSTEKAISSASKG